MPIELLGSVESRSAFDDGVRWQARPGGGLGWRGARERDGGAEELLQHVARELLRQPGRRDAELKTVAKTDDVKTPEVVKDIPKP
jgi:hypothetical protein